MCNVCLKTLRGWLKSFTRTEIFLTLLEAVLLLVFFGFLIFLILHFLLCTKTIINEPAQITDKPHTTEASLTSTQASTTQRRNQTLKTTSSRITVESTTIRTPATVRPGVSCTWKMSQKTEAYTHYFYPVTKAQSEIDFDYKNMTDVTDFTDKYSEEDNVLDVTIDIQYTKDMKGDRNLLADSDGEDATDENKQHVLALVKLIPPKHITFGCILTVVSDYWVVTAASCIEAIEEVDSLDSFVMMDGYEEVYSKNHAVSDVEIHPLYQGANRSYDLAMLKSEDSLTEGRLSPVELPELMDYFLVTIGERFTILGYGAFRTIDKSPSGRGLRQAYIHNLPMRQCPVPSDSWQLRTLGPGEAEAHPPCGRAPLCAGALYSRGTPCNYCAGSPLFRGALLFGIMSDNQQCGVSCEPQIYVNVALVAQWLESIFDNK